VLVSRKEIQDALWPDRTVDFDQAINGCIRDLRQILGDDATSPKFIRTTPKYGYTFIGDAMPSRNSFVRSAVSDLRITALISAMALAVIAAFVLAPGPGDPDRQAVVADAALSAYVKGQTILEEHDASRLDAAIDLFEAAIKESPDYALAWAGLADALYYHRSGDPIAIASARAAAGEALNREPGLARAVRRLADITFTHDWDHAAAARLFERAITLDPNGAGIRHSYAVFLLAQGDEKGAVRELNKALLIDPRSAVVASDFAWSLSLLGRHEEALRKCAILRELAPDNPRSLACPLRPLIETGRTAEAAALVRELSRARGRNLPAGEPSEVLTAFWRRGAAAPNSFARASALARLGRHEEALDMLETAHAERHPLVVFAHLYPEFAPLRDTERFRRLSQSVRPDGAV
jgi:tetratricopeptide (TPR) repeat protein